MKPFYLSIIAHTGGDYVKETGLIVDFDSIAQDTWEGQNEGFTNIILVDPVRGKSEDVTKSVLQAIADRSFREEKRPYYEAAELCEKLGIDCYEEPVEAPRRRFRAPEYSLGYVG